MNTKERFLKLTEYTTPHGMEDELIKYLPSGLRKESYGYVISIGKSRTMFTCHLDTFCYEKEKVNQIIKGNIVKTDETTILGGDNKAGVTILSYMIEQGIPGTYFFFYGEEPTAEGGGLFGSSILLEEHPDLFKQFDRAIAFDRRETNSIITRQMARYCCSDEFADALIKEFAGIGITMKKDKTGYYTDTGNFLDVICE